MAITEKPKYKWPKAQGAWPDLLHDLKTRRLALTKQADELEAEEKALKEHIIQTVPKSQASGIIGAAYKALIVSKDVPQVDTENGGWELLHAHIKKKGEFDLLNKALNKAAVQARWDAGKSVPGVKPFEVVTVSLTKI